MLMGLYILRNFYQCPSWTSVVQSDCYFYFVRMQAKNIRQMNISKIRTLWYEDMTDHRSYTHNLSSCEIKAWKHPGSSRAGFESMTSAIPVQCSTNWAMKPSGSWPLCELIRNIPVEGEEYKWIGHFTVVCLVTWPRMQVRLEVTMLWYRPLCFSHVNDN